MNNTNNNFGAGIGKISDALKKPIKLDFKFFLWVMVAIIFAIIIFLTYKFFNIGTLTLLGESDMTVYLNKTFNDPGYTALDSKGNDISSKVKVDGEVDISLIGEYQITYTLNGMVKNRTVHVVEPKEKNVTYILLQGEDIIYLNMNDKFVEPGYTVMDNKSRDLSNNVVVTGNVDTSKAGTYQLTYSVVNTENVTVSKSRTVIVIGSDITYTLTPNEFTSDKVTINLLVDNNYMEYVLLPNEKKSTEKALTYTVSKNGKYKFVVYSKGGLKEEKVINVDIIDKDNPNVTSCSVERIDTKNQMTVNASDKSGIKSYAFYVNGEKANESTESKYSVDGEVNNAYVVVTDNVGNSTKKECEMISKIVSAKVLGSTLPTELLDMAQITTFADGKVVENYTYNCKNNTRFYTSSVSKMVLGIVAAKMAEDGIINLDTNINAYWQNAIKNDFSNYTSSWKQYVGNEESLKAIVNEDTDGILKNMSLRNLLIHTSSIKDMEELYATENNTTTEYIGGSFGSTYENAVKLMQNDQIYENYEAGIKTNYDYLNDTITRDHSLAGFTMQIAMKESINEYLKKNILSALGTNSEPAFQNGNSIYFAAGYMSSANDLAMIAAAISNDGVYNGKRIFGSSAINSIKKVEKNLRNQTIAFDYKDNKYVKYGLFTSMSKAEYYNLADAINNYTSFVIIDFNTNSGLVLNMKLKSLNDKNYAVNIFNSICSYFYS